MKPFTRLLGPDEDQILLLLEGDDDGEPVLRIIFMISEGVTSKIGISQFKGWDIAERALLELPEEQCRAMVGDMRAAFEASAV